MHLDRFNLNLFVALDAVLNSRNLTEAGRSVFLTQPAMSVALKKLRQHYDDELVIYAGGETQLTPLAEVLNPRVKTLIQQAKETLKLSLQFDPETSEHTFRLVTADIIELIYFKDVLADIARQAPYTSTISLPFAYESVDKLFRSEVDLAVVSDAFASDRLACEPLFEETLACMVWSGSQAVGETLDAQGYYNLRHAAVAHAPDRLQSPVGAALSSLNRDRRVVTRTSAYSALPHIIIGTELVATTARRFAEYCASYLPIRVLPLPVPVPTLTFVAQWQPYRTHEPAMVWLRQRLRAAADRLAPV